MGTIFKHPGQCNSVLKGINCYKWPTVLFVDEEDF